MKRNGIVLMGTSVVDELVPVLHPGQLSYVDAARFVPESELSGEKIQYSVGGMALNVAVNLARINGNYPIAVCGRVGRDHRADLIRATLNKHDISVSMLVEDPEFETSWTEVLNLRMPGGELERVFRHYLGAMGRFEAADVPLEKISTHRIAMLGYGLVLPRLDMEDGEYGTVCGRLLARIKKRGIRTAIDFVSPDPGNLFRFHRYRRSMQWIDICCINDDQAMALTERASAESACRALVEALGAGLAVVHCGAEGPNYAFAPGTGLLVQPNFHVEPDEVKGNAGAGDAFSAGLIHGLHQQWPLERCLKFAAAAAAISLGDVSCTGAMRDETSIEEYMNTRSYR